MRKLRIIGLLALGLGALFSAIVWFHNFHQQSQVLPTPPSPVVNATTIARGAYLAKLGNCSACHTARGAQEYSGGEAIVTPFGRVYAGNLTPHNTHGIGQWSSDDFWRALHEGRSKDGRLLLPAFPYTSYTHVSHEDSDAMFAFFKQLPQAALPNKAHEVSTLFNNQASIAVWRTLYFRPQALTKQENQSAQWNRGAYLVQGLGHCAQCHGTRNALGGIRQGLELSGGAIPGHAWYAPSLRDAEQASVNTWRQDEIVQLLRSGLNDKASVSGPMAQVVRNSMQYASLEDLNAMAVYLLALAPEKNPPSQAKTSVSERGAQLYKFHCASCHGEQGAGGRTASGGRAYPPLTGNRAVNLPNTENVVQSILHGGYLPATELNPQPFGMPPFGHQLNDEEVSQVASYIRGAWGNKGGAVEASTVRQARDKYHY